MRALKFSQTISVTLLLACALAGAACQPGPATNTNVSTANANGANANTSPTPTLADVVSIETREPEQYSGTLVFTGTAEGQSKGIQLSIDVARSGDNRRYVFNNLPGINQVIFLDRADKRYLIMPTRKQYAEITPELLGFDVRSLTPGQMVVYLQNQRGVERVGEEQREGRTVVKYRHAATAKTTSAAGDVATESFIYVDKETGLPLHADLTGRSTGNVQGVSRASLVADMRNIQTTVDAALFELPQGLTKLSEQEIKQRVSEIAGFFQLAMGMMNTQLRGNAPGASAPTASPASGAASPGGATTTSSPVPSPTR